MEPRQLLSAGTLDPAFGSNGEVLTNQQLTYGPSYVEQFTSNGVLNQTFGDQGFLSPVLPASYGYSFGPSRQITLSNQNVLLYGFVSNSQMFTPALVELNANGTPDASFGTNGVVILSSVNSVNPSSLTVQSNGDILFADNNTYATINRLTPNGAPDATFGNNGAVTLEAPGYNTSFISRLTFDSSGNILASGQAGAAFASVGLVARLTPGGQLDTSFNGTGYVTNPVYLDPEDEYNTPVEVTAVEPDGTILTASEEGFDDTSSTVLLNRYNADGTPDTAFGDGGQLLTSVTIGNGFPGTAYAAAQSDGKIVLAIDVGPYYDSAYELVRFDSDGSLDSTFGSGGYVNGPGAISSISIGANGQLYGSIALSNDNPAAAFDTPPTRFNSNGSIDTTYGDDGVGIGEPNFTTGEAVAVLPSGQSLTAGLVVVGDQIGIYVQRYNNDGSLDATFAPGAGLGGANGYAFLGINNEIPPTGLEDIGIKVNSVGQIIVGANFNNAQAGVNTAEFFGLNSNGTIDTSFGVNGIAAPMPGGQPFILDNFTVDISNRIVATGDGSNLPVIRLTANGALDSTFGSGGKALADPSNSVYSQITSIAMAANGQILIGESGGSSTSPEMALTRLNSNGSIDTSFGANGLAIAPLHFPGDKSSATALAVLPNGDIVASGGETVASTGGQTFVIAEFLPNGQLNPSFGVDGEFINETNPIALQLENINNILVQSDGKLLATGTYFYGGHAQIQQFFVARLNSNGTLDSTFNGGVVYTKLSNDEYPSTYLLGAALTPDGDLEVIGDIYQAFVILRYQLDIPATTSPQLTGTIIGTAGSWDNLGNTVSKAFDGILTDYFDGPVADSDYAGLSFATPEVITQIGYDPRDGYAGRMVGGIFQGANNANFSDAVTLYTVAAAPPNDTLTMVTISNTSAFSYVRYLGPANSYGDVGELAFFGHVPAASQLTGTIIGTAGSWDNLGNTVSKAFDGNLSDYFDGPTANGDYAGLNLGTSKVITQIGYDPRTGYASRMIGGIFQGANNPNFTGAVNLYTITTAPPNQTLTEVSITNSTAFQYVRYLAPDNSYGDVGELAFYGYVPTVVQLTGTVIGTPGSYQNQGNTIANVFDGNLSTFFDAPSASGDWAGLDLGTAQVVTQVSYAPRAGWTSRMIGGEIQASNSANFSSGVVTLFTIAQAPTAGILTTQALTNTQAYRYYRYIGPTGSYCNIAELELFS